MKATAYKSTLVTRIKALANAIDATTEADRLDLHLKELECLARRERKAESWRNSIWKLN